MTAIAQSTEQVALAVHEAGHAVAAVLLGSRSNGVTMNEERGVSFHASDLCPDGAVLMGSVLLIDRNVRDHVERGAVITLAGSIAEELWTRPDSDGYRLEPATLQESERLTRELERSGFMERVESYDAEPPLKRRSDDEKLARLTLMWCGTGSAAAQFVGWLREETVALVRSAMFARPLRAVAEALLQHGALPGSEVHRLVNENTYPWENEHGTK